MIVFALMKYEFWPIVFGDVNVAGKLIFMPANIIGTLIMLAIGLVELVFVDSIFLLYEFCAKDGNPRKVFKEWFGDKK